MSRFPILALATAAVLAGGCGMAVYRPAAGAGFQLDPDREIDDEAIRKAFEARPQLRTPARLAYLVFGDHRAKEVEQMLRALPGVSDVYRIPELLATGRRATLSHTGRHAALSMYSPSQPPSIRPASSRRPLRCS